MENDGGWYVGILNPGIKRLVYARSGVDSSISRALFRDRAGKKGPSRAVTRARVRANSGN